MAPYEDIQDFIEEFEGVTRIQKVNMTQWVLQLTRAAKHGQSVLTWEQQWIIQKSRGPYWSIIKSTRRNVGESLGITLRQRIRMDI